MIEGAALFAVATTGYAVLGYLAASGQAHHRRRRSRATQPRVLRVVEPAAEARSDRLHLAAGRDARLPSARGDQAASDIASRAAADVGDLRGLLLVVLDRLFQVVAHDPVGGGTRCSQRSASTRWSAFYAANGMAEIVYLFFLVAGVYQFMRWYLTRAPGALIAASVCFALGVLSRYEVFIWAAVLTVTVALTAIRQRVSRAELEGTLLTYLAPIAYGTGLWLFFNWLILGDPFYFLKLQAPGAGIDATAAATQAVTPVVDSHPGHVAAELLRLNVELYPVVALVVLALAVVLYRRRDLMTFSLIVLLVLNAVFTFVLVWRSGAQTYLQLRYNMRAMPLALVAIAWLYLIAQPRFKRAAWAASLVAVVASIPFTAYAMEHYAYQYLELDFMAAVLHDKSVPSALAGVDPMARYISAHDRVQNSILVDDSQTFAVMLRTGRPDLFWDRIDKGDPEWLDVLAVPWGHVQYMLLASDDLIARRYPLLLEGKPVLGMSPVYVTHQRTQRFVLVRVAAHRPPPPGGISRR